VAKPSIEQFHELHNLAKSGKVYRENLQNFLRNPDAWKPEPTIMLFTAQINRSISLSTMIGGNYGKVSSMPREFSGWVSGKNKEEVLEVGLLSFGQDINLKGALEVIKKMGYRAATFQELLAFGASHPESHECNILALGTRRQPGESKLIVVPQISCLLPFMSHKERNLDLKPLEGILDPCISGECNKVLIVPIT